VSFWSNWSDGKKWFMGIASALLLAALVPALQALFSRREPGGGASGPPPAAPVACQARVGIILDDHAHTDSSYRLSILHRGTAVFERKLREEVPHGAPAGGGAFSNWSAIEFPVLVPPEELTSEVKFDFYLSGGRGEDWIGVSEIRLNCASVEYVRSVRGKDSYGPGGVSTGILYIGGSATWAVPMR